MAYIRRYCGPIVYEISGGKFKHYCGPIRYEVQDSFSQEEWMGLITLLYGGL